MPRSFIEYGVNSLGGSPDFYRKDAPKIFANVQNPALQAELVGAVEPVARAMQDLVDWLSNGAARATDNFALGPDKVADVLSMTERVTTPLGELERVGRDDLERATSTRSGRCAQHICPA